MAHAFPSKRIRGEDIRSSAPLEFVSRDRPRPSNLKFVKPPTTSVGSVRNNEE